MLSINFQFLANLKNFKLLTPRQSSFYQLRLNVYSQPISKKKVHQFYNQKKPQPLIPYLILTPETKSFTQNKKAVNNVDPQFQTQQQQGIAEHRSSFNRISSLQVENSKNTPNLSQIDSETNSFLTRPFFVQRVDHFVALDEVIVFKGMMEISIDEIYKSIEQSKDKNVFLNKLLISCELLLVSSYSTESIGEWYGYTMRDQGNVVVPVSYFAYNSSFSQVEMMFLWTSMEVKQGRDFSSKKLEKIAEFLQGKLNKVLQMLQVPAQISVQKGLSNNQALSFSQKGIQLLDLVIKQYNQRVNFRWKLYQQYQQKSITQTKLSLIANKIFNEKLNLYEKSLKEYHWKNNIIVTEEIEPQPVIKQKVQQQEQLRESLNLEERKNKNMPAQLRKLKKNLTIDSQLLFYPFAAHQRMLKLDNQDFNKISKISSLLKPTLFNSNSLQQKPYHLIIFVHGYQASGYDMQNLACFLKYKQPSHTRTFVSTCNQGRTQQPIQQSGHRLAVQIKNFINNKFQHYNEQYDISFVCHSMGGLIARAALKYLQLYKKKFRTFLSLCSPHLGYLYHSSALIKTSLWVLNQVKKDPSMIQLTMQDNSILQKTYLYELSQKQELQWFRYPIFIGSRQDQYVPFWSALVRDKDFYFQTRDAKIYKQLYKNLAQKLEGKMIRLQAIYKDKVNDISSFVGRTAHIRILNSIEVMELIYLLLEGAL